MDDIVKAVVFFRLRTSDYRLGTASTSVVEEQRNVTSPKADVV
jgi:hypothetical protein